MPAVWHQSSLVSRAAKYWEQKLATYSLSKSLFHRILFACFVQNRDCCEHCRRKQKLSVGNGEVSSPERPAAYSHICIYKTHLIDRVFTVWLSGSSRFLLHSPLILKKSNVVSPSSTPPPSSGLQERSRLLLHGSFNLIVDRRLWLSANLL